jgi:hypothetical protein
MDNQEWFRDIENIISEYFNQRMNNEQSPNNTNTPPSNTNTFFRNEDLSENRLYLLINEFMQDYYANIRLYQENARDMIQLLREFRNGNPQPRRETRNTNPFRQPMQRPQPAPQIPSQQNNPSLSTTFAYFIQPFNTEQEQSVGLTTEQIDHAIETITYDESISTRYNELDAEDTSYERCPICLEDFQIGEEVCRIRVCGHVFKRPGLMYWFSRNNHCPLCRCEVNVQPAIENNQIQPNDAVNNLIQNHIRNPFMRELGSFIQTMAENNRNGRPFFPFVDVSGNFV